MPSGWSRSNNSTSRSYGGSGMSNSPWSLVRRPNATVAGTGVRRWLPASQSWRVSRGVACASDAQRLRSPWPTCVNSRRATVHYEW